MQKINRLLALILVLVSCVGCDQATKLIARQNLAGAPPIEFASRMVRLEYAENPGAFLGLGATWSAQLRFWVFTVAALFMLVLLVVLAFRLSQATPLLVVAAIALTVGGGLSNLIDRIFNEGRVVDFMQVGIGGLRTGIFNVADMALMAGLALIVIESFQQRSAAQHSGKVL